MPPQETRGEMVVNGTMTLSNGPPLGVIPSLGLSEALRGGDRGNETGVVRFGNSWLSVCKSVDSRNSMYSESVPSK